MAKKSDAKTQPETAADQPRKSKAGENTRRPRRRKQKSRAKSGPRKPKADRFIATESQRTIVSILAAEDVTNESISDHLGISLSTLKKHFAKELIGGSSSLLILAHTRLITEMKTAGSKGGTRAAIYIADKMGKKIEKAEKSQRASGQVQIDPETGEAHMTVTLDIGEAGPADGEE